jgi:hypothetical protein
MGHTTGARCSACEYTAYLMVGSSMANFKTYAAWPVSCVTCSEITTANHRRKPLVCEACNGTEVVPLNDPAVWLGDGEKNGHVGQFDTERWTLSVSQVRPV